MPCRVALFYDALINLTVGVRRPTHFIKLTRAVKEDIALWLEFLSNYNGKSFFLDFNWLSSKTLDLYTCTDASSSLGYGAAFGQYWFYGPWRSKWTSKNIIVLEMLPIVINLRISALRFILTTKPRQRSLTRNQPAIKSCCFFFAP